MKVAIVTAIRFLAVTILYFICFAFVSGALLSTAIEQPAPADASATLLPLLIVSLINAAVWTYVILRSRWSGWKLVMTVFLVSYGVSTVMSQIETAYFVTRLPPGVLARLFLAGMLTSVLFAPLAVLFHGKFKSQPNEKVRESRLSMPVRAWIVKLCLIVIVYVFLYFTFGYFIAWRNPAVQAYYGGTDPGSFISHITNLLRSEPLLFLLQAGRALLWTVIAVPVIQMTKGKWWEAGLAVALLFGVFMNSLLLLPNPLMPAEVRMAHLVETATSNFLFGWLIVLILRARISSS
ncbi:MAG TPA: hypothetical protein VJM12_13940 [Pyrinomonadaceae bacterium]|nr:hypothetical protein [Pyrinomonadaceae bacterium]